MNSASQISTCGTSVHRFDIVIPARNEADFIASTVESLAECQSSSRIIVVDNASTDATARKARDSGAEVVDESRVGKGFALAAGWRAAVTRVVFCCDADVFNVQPEWASFVAGPVLAGLVPFCRGVGRRSDAGAPVTRLVADPLLKLLFPAMGPVQEPLGGIFAIEREFALGLHLPGGWGVDVALTLEVVRRFGQVIGLPLPEVRHRLKGIGEYKEMARDVAAAILEHAGVLTCSHCECVKCLPAQTIQALQPSTSD